METNNERAVRALEQFWEHSLDMTMVQVNVLALRSLLEADDTALVQVKHLPPPPDVENGPSPDDIPDDPDYYVVCLSSGKVYDWVDAAL